MVKLFTLVLKTTALEIMQVWGAECRFFFFLIYKSVVASESVSAFYLQFFL